MSRALPKPERQDRMGTGVTGLACHSGRVWSTDRRKWFGVYGTFQMGRRREGRVTTYSLSVLRLLMKLEFRNMSSEFIDQKPLDSAWKVATEN